MRIAIKLEDIRNPMNSCDTVLWIEQAFDCDGSVCGNLFGDLNGNKICPPPHQHIVVAGRRPEASARYFLIP